MRKLFLCAATTFSLAAATVPAIAQANSGSVRTSQAPTVSPINWGTCASAGLQRRGAECATLQVPLDYEKPAGDKVGLAISRIKHKVPDAQYQGVMLVNPGGPGGSGLTLSVLGEYVPKDAGLAYDWIGFDPRGVGSSTPAVSCDPQYAGFNRPQYDPTTEAIENAWRTKASGYSKDCGDKNGPILDHLKTTDSAKDMNSIREALGVKQINYYGFSYGTYLGQVFATMYPDKLRRVVFDGTVNPKDVWYDANLNQDVAFDRNINIWFGWLAKHNDVYKLGTTAEAVNKLFYATQKKLYDVPAEGTQGKLGGSEWTDAFLYAGYYQSTWLGLAETFSAFINDNDVDALQSAYLDVSGLGNDNGYAVYTGVQCTDVQWPQKWSTWERDNTRINKIAPFETWANAWYNAPCLDWPAKAGQPVKVTGKDVKSLLMINETLDAATPYAGSLEVRKLFPNASLIAVPGGTTHSNSLNGNVCVDDQIADYLIDGTLPARRPGNKTADTECAALPQPDPSAQARQKSAAPPADDITRWDLQKISKP